MVVELNEENFEEEVLKADKKVIVDFYATWCGPCKMQGPIVEKLAEENDSVKVCKLDVDNAPSIAEKYDIMSIPTIILFKDGNAVNKKVGLADMDELKLMI